MPDVENILQVALRLTSQDRRQAYGPPSEEFEHAAAMWSALLRKKLKEPITAEEYALCMVLVKVVRQSYKGGRDNLIDIAGYARTIEMLSEELTSAPDQPKERRSRFCEVCQRCLCVKCEEWHRDSKCAPLTRGTLRLDGSARYTAQEKAGPREALEQDGSPSEQLLNVIVGTDGVLRPTEQLDRIADDNQVSAFIAATENMRVRTEP
jgi:hypothetical protein